MIKGNDQVHCPFQKYASGNEQNQKNIFDKSQIPFEKSLALLVLVRISLLSEQKLKTEK